MTAAHRSWDDYFIPGTAVLRNKLTTATTPCGFTKKLYSPAQIVESDYLRGLTKDAFVTELADRWSELNTGGSALLV